MAQNAVIGQEDLLILLDVYKSKRSIKEAESEEAKNKWMAARDEVTALNAKIDTLQDQLQSLLPSKKMGKLFPAEGTWNERIAFILEEAKLPLTTSEIVDKIHSYMTDWERTKLVTSISATISSNMDKKYKRQGDGIVLK